MSLLILPDDLNRVLLDFLPSQELLTYTRVCKRLNSFCMLKRDKRLQSKVLHKCNHGKYVCVLHHPPSSSSSVDYYLSDQRLTNWKLNWHKYSPQSGSAIITCLINAQSAIA